MQKEQGLNDVQAAAFLGLAPQTMRNLRCRCAGPPYFKLGRRIVYRVADLEKYLADRRVDPEAQGI
jgi:hypothetical protein